jgi:hypothetical protein
MRVDCITTCVLLMLLVCANGSGDWETGNWELGTGNTLT